MAEYRRIREKHAFLDMCRKPEVAAEITMQPVDKLGVDAAILFADILLILEPLGLDLSFREGEGPHIANPVRTGADVDGLRDPQVRDSLAYVYEAVRMVRQALPANVPLIGFCGGPFTVASYAIEGHGSRDYIHTKTLMYTNSAAWHALMGKLATALGAYLGGQVAAGASAVQLFDSWVGALSADDYRTYVLPHTKAVIAALPAGVPVIHFGTGTATLLEAMREAGGSVIGLDWRVRLDEAWERIGYDRGVQGNLDPAVLLAGPQFIREKAVGVLNQAAGRPGHIFNLGHGVFRQTPVENVRYLVDVVHEFSSHGARR